MAPAGLSPPAARTAIYVGGRWLDRPQAARLPVTNPTTEEVFAEVVEATAEDVAAAVAFLASDAAGYITGQVIHVNGGMFMG